MTTIAERLSEWREQTFRRGLEADDAYALLDAVEKVLALKREDPRDGYGVGYNEALRVIRAALVEVLGVSDAE